MKTKYKCLYEITGRIEDVATFLVPISELPKEPEQEPVAKRLDPDDAWNFAKHVWNEMDKKSMPGIYMQMVTEAIVKHYTTPPQRKEPEQVSVANGKLKVTLQDTPTEIELAQYKRMFAAACADLGEINEALGLDPDDGGAEPILSAIAELKLCQTCEALARTVMLDQTSHDTSPPAQRKPLTDEQIHAIYDEVARQEPYMGAVTRRNVARAIEAAHGIKE